MQKLAFIFKNIHFPRPTTTLLHPVSTPQILMELKTLLKRGLIMHFSTLQHYNLPLEDFLTNTTFCVTFFIRILRSFLTLPSF